jgi:hypothetical protein
MRVLPQALPTVQILQQDWAGGVERCDPLTPMECNSLLCAWGCVKTVSMELGAVSELAEVVSERRASNIVRVHSMAVTP